MPHVVIGTEICDVFLMSLKSFWLVCPGRPDLATLCWESTVSGMNPYGVIAAYSRFILVEVAHWGIIMHSIGARKRHLHNSKAAPYRTPGKL